MTNPTNIHAGQRVLAPDGTVGLVVSVVRTADPQRAHALVAPVNPRSYPRRFYAATLTAYAPKG
jgi:hypothetical protein